MTFSFLSPKYAEYLGRVHAPLNISNELRKMFEPYPLIKFTKKIIDIYHGFTKEDGMCLNVVPSFEASDLYKGDDSELVTHELSHFIQVERERIFEPNFGLKQASKINQWKNVSLIPLQRELSTLAFQSNFVNSLKEETPAIIAVKRFLENTPHSIMNIPFGQFWVTDHLRELGDAQYCLDYLSEHFNKYKQTNTVDVFLNEFDVRYAIIENAYYSCDVSS